MCSVETAPGISASPLKDNMRYFNVMILGPTQSPYEGKTLDNGHSGLIVSLKVYFSFDLFLFVTWWKCTNSFAFLLSEINLLDFLVMSVDCNF